MDGPAFKVLVVDDEDYSRFAIVRSLEVLRLTDVVQAGDGDTALAILEDSEQRIDLVVTDLWMPNLSGLQLLETVRGGSRPGIDPLVPIIVVTGDEDQGLAARICKHGVDGYIVKPATAEKLGERILMVMSGDRASARDGTQAS
ncbi:MAG: response regulator [Alphaproteobacteria bacterium]|nr:response regulator [Alphaproteobacteria bacterium]